MTFDSLKYNRTITIYIVSLFPFLYFRHYCILAELLKGTLMINEQSLTFDQTHCD